MTEQISISLMDAETGDEIEGVNFPSVLSVPRAGESIHYWQDGTEERAGGDAVVRRDFDVIRVEHDLRFLPARGGRPMYVQTVLLHVTEREPKG